MNTAYGIIIVGIIIYTCIGGLPQTTSLRDLFFKKRERYFGGLQDIIVYFKKASRGKSFYYTFAYFVVMQILLIQLRKYQWLNYELWTGIDIHIIRLHFQSSFESGVFVICLLAALFLLLPLAAWLEELVLRYYTTSILGYILKSLLLGLLVFLAGVSLADSIAVVITGLYFSVQFSTLRRNFEKIVAQHLVYNSLVFGILAKHILFG
jgi:hypothetical protein